MTILSINFITLCNSLEQPGENDPLVSLSPLASTALGCSAAAESFFGDDIFNRGADRVSGKEGGGAVHPFATCQSSLSNKLLLT